MTLNANWFTKFNIQVYIKRSSRFETNRSKRNLRAPTMLSNSIWKTKALRILYFVSKFLSQLKQNTDRIKFKMLDRKIFEVIDDKASDFEFYIRRKLIYKNVSFMTYLLMQIKHSLSYLPIEWLK